MATQAERISSAIASLIFTMCDRFNSGQPRPSGDEIKSFEQLTAALTAFQTRKPGEVNILEQDEVKYDIVCVKNPHSSVPRVWSSYKTRERADRELATRNRRDGGGGTHEFKLAITTIHREIVEDGDDK